jgi:hypothetical protein
MDSDDHPWWDTELRGKPDVLKGPFSMPRKRRRVLDNGDARHVTAPRPDLGGSVLEVAVGLRESRKHQRSLSGVRPPRSSITAAAGTRSAQTARTKTADPSPKSRPVVARTAEPTS